MKSKSSLLVAYSNKFSEFITKMRYRNHEEFYRDRYIKYYYVGLIYQYRYLLKDYVVKNKYKIIKYDGEFGPELKYVIPFAYWHYHNATLRKTISSTHTNELYYFSNNHEEYYQKRVWRPYQYGIPNSEDHNIKYNFKQWLPVPYKDKYKNNIIQFDKPILIIANKYNIEWGEAPINYIDIDTLIWIFENYSDKYQIIYNRPVTNNITNDNSDILSFDDFKVIKHDYKKILNMNELYDGMKNNEIRNYNHFQLMLYANANHFISVHGGASVLASYFKGMNIIYSIKGFEHYFDEFNNLYPKLSGARILHAKSNNDIKHFMNRYY